MGGGRRVPDHCRNRRGHASSRNAKGDLERCRAPGYRIDEFFCFDDTWRPTVDQLLTRCDVVVMDLRSFGAENQGSAHELELLTSRGALSRTVLLVDHRTDLVLLHSILGSGDHGGATLLEAKNGDLDEALSALAAASAMIPTAPRK